MTENRTTHQDSFDKLSQMKPSQERGNKASFEGLGDMKPSNSSSNNRK